MRPVSKIDAVKRDRSLLPVNAAFKPEMTYEESLLENKKLVALLVDFFAGKTKPIQESIMDLMKDAVAHQHFEYAGQLRDIYA
jgi:excinuclease UvrABC nuclease subunit